MDDGKEKEISYDGIGGETGENRRGGGRGGEVGEDV